MTITGRRRDRTQSGFTLIETLIGMTIVGVIIAVLANALIIGLKTTDKTTDSLIQSHDQQVVSAHLVTDLQNVRHDGVGIDVPATCGPAGTAKLQLGWSDAVTGALFTATYQVTDSGASLTRSYCEGATLKRSVVLASALDPAVPPVVVVPSSRRVEVRFREMSGYTFTIGADRRTPGPTTSSSSTSSSSSSSTSTTVSPPCTADTPPDRTAKRQSSGSQKDTLQNPVNVTITGVAATCGALHLDFDTGFTTTSQPLTPATGTPREGAIPHHKDKWTVGDHIIYVKANSDESVITSFILTVTS